MMGDGRLSAIAHPKWCVAFAPRAATRRRLRFHSGKIVTQASGQRSKLASMHAQQGSELFSAIVAAPFGAVGIRTDAGSVRELVYLPPHFAKKDATDAAAELTARQVTQYFDDPDFVFSLPLMDAGSAYQQRVWAAISAIARGSVRTYGQACGANWFPLVIPCHRVTAAGGLGGFANHADEHGFHLSVKRWLLRHEGATASPWQQQAIWP